MSLTARLRSLAPLLGALACLFLAPPALAATPATTTTTFSTPGCADWTTPSEISNVQILVVGAAGASYSNGPGGVGDGITATVVDIPAGQVLDVCVNVGGGSGGQPSLGLSGGKGGGASGLALGADFSDPLVVAGGGGGGGGYTDGAGAGGNAGSPAGSAGIPGSPASPGTTGGGEGGPSAAGLGGDLAASGTSWSSSGPGAGGAGGSSAFGAGGGGGGGYWGAGGGGGMSGAGGGGGGGADFCQDTSLITSCFVTQGEGVNPFVGRVVLTYDIGPPQTTGPCSGAGCPPGSTPGLGAGGTSGTGSGRIVIYITRPGPSCPSKTSADYKAYVTGRDISHVDFYVDGDKVATATKAAKDGRWEAVVDTRYLTGEAHALTTKTYFTSHERPVDSTTSFEVCRSTPPLRHPPQIERLRPVHPCLEAAVLGHVREGRGELALSYYLTQAAEVTYTVARRTDSPVRTTCPAAGDLGDHPSATKRVGSARSDSAQGEDTTSIGQGQAASITRVAHRPIVIETGHLRPGTYEVLARAHNVNGSSNTVVAYFWVLAPKGHG